MARLGEEGEWQQVVECDQNRVKLLETCLGGGVPETEKPYAVKMLQEIQSLNDQLVEKARKERSEVAEQFKLFNSQKDASAAYGACQNLSEE